MSELLGLGNFERKIPADDERARLVCKDCGFIYYENPKVVVGAVCHWNERILLCRRAIPPQRGYWTLPAGYLELQESTLEGTLREAWEEARARIEIEGVLAIYSIPRISQVQVIHRARLLSPDVEPGPESLEVGLFGWDEIPRGDIAFPSVHWALDHYREAVATQRFETRTNPSGELGER